MIDLKMNRSQLIEKIIADNRKSVVRELVKSGKINEIETFEYSNYADDVEMKEILNSKSSCLDYIKAIKLNKKWFDFVVTKYVKEELDADILGSLVDLQTEWFDIDTFDYLGERVPMFKERLLSSSVIRNLNPELLGDLVERKLVPESVICDLSDSIARATCKNKIISPNMRHDIMQVIMIIRKISKEEMDCYLESVSQRSKFVYEGSLGILLCSQVVPEELIIKSLNEIQIDFLPKERKELDNVARWLRGILRKQNLDNILDLVLEKIDNNELLIEEIFRHNKETSVKTLLKLAVQYKDIAYKFDNTGYAILESHKF